MNIWSSVVRVGFCAIVATGVAEAADLYVQKSVGNDSNPGDAWGAGHALATIQRALTLAGNQVGADTIHVAAGTYAEHLVIGTNDVTLLGSYPASGSGPRDLATTPSIVDGTDTGIAIDVNATSHIAIDRFRVIRGRNIDPMNGLGGGVSIHYTGAVSLTNNQFLNNRALSGGGIGIVGNSGLITLTGNEIRGNTGDDSGGGIGLFHGAALIDGNILSENNGNTDSGKGGGLRANDATLTLTGNTISGNQARDGGGVSLESCVALEAEDNVIVSNRANYDGGGIYYNNCTGRLAGNRIQNNESVNWGGGICIFGAHAEPLINNLITNNVSHASGGGVSLYNGASATMINDTLANNLADGAGSGVFVDSGTAVTVRNSILWGNQNAQIQGSGAVLVTYSDVAGGWSGVGNLSQDPLFAAPATGDYHLRSQGGRYNPMTASWVTDNQHSPAIDAGNPTDSFANETQPNGARINLGAFGNTSQASRSFIDMKLPDRGGWRAILGH